ncbi:50S ribosomal protein L4 sunset domain variant [Aestuariimicrobium soli]|uniref:50S ribosomal protein L4, sunset domain variant n=1 Tax=Aestuariimicrobium soli TaxID=2035834 RepID=UPI003EBC217D
MSETVKAATSAELPAEYFDVQTNVPLIHQVVVAQQAAARQGTHSTKTRGEVRGGGAKPWRQKGTGRARQGSRRAPQWTGGGIVHGPQPHGYAQRTPKKMIQAALRGALSDRARDGKIFVLDQIVTGETPSTKQALASLAQVGDAGKLLVVLHRDDDVAWLSLRNVAEVHVLAVDQLNAYDVLVAEATVFTKAALDVFVAGPAKGKSVKAVATETEAAAASIQPLAAVSDEPAADEATSSYGEGSYEGAEPPAGYDIKGNADSMKFHTPESPWYSRTKAEVWFNSVEAAQAAGFVSATGDEGADDEETEK